MSPEQLAAQLREQPAVKVRGGGSKGALSAGATLALGELRGVTSYDPQEFTFSALAGTPLREINAMLAERGQYLPFDPPLVEAGATLGGTVASGLSGSGRLRYGGVRDFILGVRFIDGRGEILQGGGRVVKNAAGFDFPKLMVGALGRFGVLVELTFKVFPAPQAYATLEASFASAEAAVRAMHRLAASPLELFAIDYLPPATLQLRLAGREQALSARLAKLAQQLEGAMRYEGEAEAALWREVGEFGWAPPDQALLKVPLSPSRLLAFDAAVAPLISARRYAVAGNVGYLALPAERLSELEALLCAHGLRGLALWGAPRPYWGMPLEQRFSARLAQVLDPQGKFGGMDAA